MKLEVGRKYNTRDGSLTLECIWVAGDDSDKIGQTYSAICISTNKAGDRVVEEYMASGSYLSSGTPHERDAVSLVCEGFKNWDAIPAWHNFVYFCYNCWYSSSLSPRRTRANGGYIADTTDKIELPEELWPDDSQKVYRRPE